ncbi:A/G-specific adenine glycosylase [bacterium]|nr:A/G-specific adenine glycosylase [bacterium]
MKIAKHIKLKLNSCLLSWFEQHQRPLPWRQTSDPYRIWISEVMLQQTQVTTVESYFHRFIRQYPNVQSLAEADLHHLMKVWEGLGYYSRARHLHAAAQEIVSRFHGVFPDNLDDLLSLPGIGRYTAGAILSIAFEKPAPILDGNAVRVLTRVFHITDNIDKAFTQNILWKLAEQILPEKNVRSFNQAVMELGALICKPGKPDCSICPISSICRANELHLQAMIPLRSPRKPVPHYDVTAGIIWRADRFLITLRPPKGLLGGLWEFPGGKVKPGETLETCLKREILEELNLRIHIKSHLVSVGHAYTHFKITLHVFECQCQAGRIRMNPDAATDFQWITASLLDQYAFPGADRKVIVAIQRKHLIRGGPE